MNNTTDYRCPSCGVLCMKHCLSPTCDYKRCARCRSYGTLATTPIRWAEYTPARMLEEIHALPAIADEDRNTYKP